jgi:hypothetical protein
MAVWGIASGTEVYKWVDENGRVNYGERRRTQPAEQLELISIPDSDLTQEARRVKQQKLLRIFAEERKEGPKGTKGEGKT